MSKPARVGLAVAACGLGLVLASWPAAGGARGNGASEGASVVVVGPIEKVRPDARPNGRTSAELFAARNEFESFQVVVGAGDSPLRGLSVALEKPLTGTGGTIPARNVTVYREAYYTARLASSVEGGAGRWPDALVPTVDPYYGERRRAFPVAVPPRENRVAWVDVLVPRNVAPGRYSGRLLVSASGLRTRIPVHLTVLALRLPSTASLTSSFGLFYTRCLSAAQVDAACPTGEEWRLRSLFAEAALDDRITISEPQFRPPLTAADRGLFRRHVLPLLDGSAATRLRGARLTSLQVDADALTTWRALAEGEGFARRAFYYACDEPGRDTDAWTACRRKAAAARARWPELSVLVTASVQDASRSGALADIDILVPLVNQLDDRPGASEYAGDQRPAYDGFLRDARRRLWTYTSCESHGCGADVNGYHHGWPNYVIDAPGSAARAMGWLAFLYRTSGELYYAVDRRLQTAWVDQWAFGGNGDGTLFYLGTPRRIGGSHTIPVESLRLKLIRDGHEDYEYLRFLGRRGRGGEATALARGLFPMMHDTTRTDAQVQAARRQLGLLVARLLGGPRP